MDAQQVIERLCELQEEVHSEMQMDETAADCFCKKGGFWHVKNYGGTADEGYRNEGEALDFIEAAVREKLSISKAIKEATRRNHG